MTKTTLKVDKRKIFGRKVKQLRKQGILPANIYGKKIKSLAIQLPLQEFNRIYSQAGETNLVYLKLNQKEKERPCLIANVQVHQVKNYYLHADFHQVDLAQKVTADIPVKLIGISPAVEKENATIITHLQTIEVEALPTDLVENFTLDISSLKKVGESLTVADLEYDKKKITIPLKSEAVIVTVQAQEEEEEEAPALVTDETKEDEIKASESREGKQTEENQANEAKTESKEETKTEDKK